MIIATIASAFLFKPSSPFLTDNTGSTAYLIVYFCFFNGGGAGAPKIEVKKLYCDYDFYGRNEQLIKSNCKWNQAKRCWEIINEDAIPKIMEKSLF